MNGGQLPTNQLHDINCGAPSHASQLMSCNYYAYVCMNFNKRFQGLRHDQVVVHDYVHIIVSLCVPYSI